MPVILDPDAYDLWLDPGMNDVAAASELLRLFDARLMRCGAPGEAWVKGSGRGRPFYTSFSGDLGVR
jgi:hypothetical protein